jgi:hypothetical protein
VGLWVVRPLRRRVTDLQVALYIEEHEPSLQAAILSAVDIGATTGAAAPVDVPPVILERMVEQAIAKCRTIEGGKNIAQRVIRQRTVVLGTLAAAAVLLLVVGPEFFRQGASALLVLSRSADAASPYAIKVTPGDVTVPKGSDQSISASLTGFRSTDVVMMVKSEGETTYQRMPLVSAGDASKFEGMLFDLKKPIRYYVEADGVRSPEYAMSLVELRRRESRLEHVFLLHRAAAAEGRIRRRRCGAPRH